MEESDRPRHAKAGPRERSMATDETDGWRNPDMGRAYIPIPGGGYQSRKNQGGPYRASPNKGAQGPLSSSPGASLRGGHSPSQKEGFRRFPGFQNNSGGRRENWRERTPQQHWREDLREDYGNRESAEGAHNSGARRRNRGRRRGFEDEDRGPVIDESTLSPEELLSLLHAEEQLLNDQISRLKKRSRSNPNALYACSLCDVMLDSLSASHRHVKDKWHKRRAREKREQAMLTEIQPPGPEQVDAVGAALKAIFLEHGLSDQDVESRRSIVSTMQELLLSVLP